MKTLIEDNLEIKFSGQFCVNFKTVRITDTIFLNILTIVQFYNFFLLFNLSNNVFTTGLTWFPCLHVHYCCVFLCL